MNSDIFNSMWVKTYLCAHNGFLKLNKHTLKIQALFYSFYNKLFRLFELKGRDVFIYFTAQGIK